MSNKHGIFKLVSGGSKTGRNVEINSRLVNIVNLLQTQPIPINNNSIDNLLNEFKIHENSLLNDLSVISKDLKLLNSCSPSFKYKKLIENLLKKTLKENYWKLDLYNDFGKLINKHQISKIYQVISIDFRGRLYALSNISHTANKSMRFIEGCKEFDATANIIQLLSIITINKDMLLTANLYSRISTDP